ncbi:MAG: NAD(P)-binding domain-containing protein [Vicinamibacteria bacterium]|nr:NAD(P)-binding domain-containing protein [Vicinamibacteria bacterium]
MKVLVADKFPDDGLAALRAVGCDVSYEPDVKGMTLEEAVVRTGAQVLIVRSTEVPGDVLRASNLGLVVRAGAGFNTIDVKTASERGIYVSNCPGKNAIAVAELAFGLILALDRHIPDGVADLRAGLWNKAKYSKARGLHGRTLGIVGLGNIGLELAHRARAFGMPVCAWSRSLTDAVAREHAIVRLDSPQAVAAASNVVSVHLALKPETRGLIGADFFAAMHAGSLFINTSRAEVVDEMALSAAIHTKGIRCGLDVFNGEPAGGTGTVDSALLREPNVYASHHVGASTDQAQEAIARETVRIVVEYQATGRVPNCVNIARRTPATHLLVVRHLNRVGVLAHVFGHLREAGVNVSETENVVFDGAVAAIARIQVDHEPPAEALDAIRAGSADVLELSVVAID